MSEAALWRGLRIWLRGHWDAQRHEDRVTSGIPDVSYGIDDVDGWIELKYLPRWPVRGGPLRVPHLTQEQRIWLRRRGIYGGGRVFVLLGVGRDRVLVPWQHLPRIGEATREELEAVSTVWYGWPLNDTREKVVAALKKGFTGPGQLV